MNQSDYGEVMVDRSLPGAGVGLVASQLSGSSFVESDGVVRFSRRSSLSLQELESLQTSMTSMTRTLGWEGHGEENNRAVMGVFRAVSADCRHDCLRMCPPVHANQLRYSDAII
jgi:hypothetical protein